MIKGIFPSYGKAFLQACLKSFNYNIEQTIDGILNENLPPNILKIDRSAESIAIGKSSLKTAFSEKENKVFKEIQLSRIKAMEREEKENARVIAEEYDDDYDDQYDDMSHFAISQGDTLETSTDTNQVSMKKSTNNNKVINWDVKMTDMKRLNSLIFKEEEEQRYWESMRNTNHDRASTSQNNDNTNSANSNTTANSKSNYNKSGSSNGNNSNNNNNTNGKPKFRTKTFDKHHQKDKALRKMS
eukprot:gene18639-24380_t